MEADAVKVDDLQIKREPDIQEEIKRPFAIFIKTEPGDEEEEPEDDPLEVETSILPDEPCAATSVDEFYMPGSCQSPPVVPQLKSKSAREEEHVSGKEQFEEKTFGCNDCNKKYFSKISLIKHLRVHNGNNPFPCTMCNSSFLYKSVLELHMQEHFGEMPYKCSVCSNRYSDKVSLNAHLRNHRGEKYFECLYCDKKFTYKRNYKQHLFVHNIKKLFNSDVQ